MIGLLGLFGVALISGLLLDPFEGKTEAAHDTGDDAGAGEDEDGSPRSVLEDTADGEVERIPDLWEVDAAFAEGEGTLVIQSTAEDPTFDAVVETASEEVAEVPPEATEASGLMPDDTELPPPTPEEPAPSADGAILPPGTPEASTLLADGAEFSEEIRVIPQEEGVWIAGTSADETLEGTDEPDAIFGAGGADTILGGEGGDLLHGENGDDDVRGGDGDDTLHGGRGDDVLVGEQGDDEIDGHSGNDELIGGDGGDGLVGGEGDDSLSGGAGNDTLEGGLGDDRLDGGAGEDLLMGGAGDDVLHGGDDAVRDQLNGGAGNDTITLGAGDEATGSGGADLFVVGSDPVVSESETTVTDFDPERDMLEIVHPGETPPDVTASEEGEDTLLFADGSMIVRLSNVTEFDVATVRFVQA